MWQSEWYIISIAMVVSKIADDIISMQNCKMKQKSSRGKHDGPNESYLSYQGMDDDKY